MTLRPQLLPLSTVLNTTKPQDHKTTKPKNHKPSVPGLFHLGSCPGPLLNFQIHWFCGFVGSYVRKRRDGCWYVLKRCAPQNHKTIKPSVSGLFNLSSCPGPLLNFQIHWFCGFVVLWFCGFVGSYVRKRRDGCWYCSMCKSAVMAAPQTTKP